MKKYYLKKKSNLNMESITESDQSHAERIFNGFEIKGLGEYHDFHLYCFHLPSLLLAFETFRIMCLEIYELDPVKFCPASGFAWQET